MLLQKDRVDDVDVLTIDVPDSAAVEIDCCLNKVARTAYYSRTHENPSKDSCLGDGETGIVVNESELEENSDIHVPAVQKLVSVTFLTVDLSLRIDLEDLHSHFEN